MDRIQVNGVPAGIDDLKAMVTTNYGHFTSMQVVGRAVRGLDLHLARLDAATRELFGTPLDLVATRRWMRQIMIDDDAAASLRVNVFSRALDRDRLAAPSSPDVLITTAAARTQESTPLRVRSAVYRREQPHIKHVGTFGLFDQRRRAQQRGFDDALFVDEHGVVSEGSIWNVGFLDDDGVVWPDAPALVGVSLRLLQAGLAECGVPMSTRRIVLADLTRFRSAFFCNASLAVRPIASIDDVVFAASAARFDVIEHAYATQPWQSL